MQFCIPSFPDKFILFRTGGILKSAQHTVLRQTAFCKLQTATQAVWRVCGNRISAV
jgi:hypothetical protein